MKTHYLFLFALFQSVSLHTNAYNLQTDSLLRELKFTKSDSLRTVLLLNINEDGQVSQDSALQFVREALIRAEASNSPRLISSAHNYLTHWYIANTQNFDSMLFYCRKHLARMEQLNYASGIAHAYMNLGRAYLWNSLDSSMYYNVKALELYQSIKELGRANNVRINLANVYIEMHKYPEAVSILQTAAQYCRDSGEKGLHLIYFNMGGCYLRMSDLENAEKSMKAGIAVNDSTPYDIGYGNAQLADVYCAQGRFGEAAKLLAAVLESGKHIRNDYLLYLGYYGMAELSYNQKKWADAIRYKKISWAYSFQDRDTKESMHQMIYKCDSFLGNYRESLFSFQQYIAVRDSYENQERLKSADALEAKYQNKEKQAQIELLNKDNAIRRAAADRQALIRNISLAFTGVVVLVGLLFFNRFKLKKKIERQQAIISERKRISRELHDDLGAQLSTARMFLNNLKSNTTDKGALLENSLSIIDSSINDLRKIMDDLHTSTLQEKGFIAATEELVNKINQLRQINFTLSHHGLDKRLGQNTEHNLFRITQELINNSLKYAKAGHVSIDVINRDGKVVLMFEDDGVGFDVRSVKKGYGLSNIDSRVRALAGTVEMDSSPGAGTRTIIEIPLAHDGKKD